LTLILGCARGQVNEERQPLPDNSVLGRASSKAVECRTNAQIQSRRPCAGETLGRHNRRSDDQPPSLIQPMVCGCRCHLGPKQRKYSCGKSCAWRIVISPMIPQDFPPCYYSSMRNLRVEESTTGGRCSLSCWLKPVALWARKRRRLSCSKWPIRSAEVGWSSSALTGLLVIIRTDPRYADLRRRMGLSQLQFSTSPS
jgi:hypothetical protein